MATKSVLLLASLFFSYVYASPNCYFPNGTMDNNYVACDTNAPNSACCASTDECLTNGLCRPVNSTGEANDYWRDLCTDQTWESDACPKFCYNQETSKA